MTAPLVLVPYFKEICLEVLETFMEDHGFNYQPNEDFRGVIFVNNSLILEVSYWPEDFPEYAPSINIGFYDGSSCHMIGFWAVLPDASVLNCGNWRFSNSEELSESLIRLRDNVMSVYGPALWSDKLYLIKIINRCESDLQVREQEIFQQEMKEIAEKEFKAGNYSEALMLYSKLNSTMLSAVDLKKIEIAKKKIRR